MPYSKSQNRLFWAAAKNEAIAKEHGLSMGKADAVEGLGVPSRIAHTDVASNPALHLRLSP